MLRLAIPKTLNILTKKLASNANYIISVNHSVNHFNRIPKIITNNHRLFSLTTANLCDANAEEEEKEEVVDDTHILWKRYAGTARDRSRFIPVEQSIEYIKSPAFRSTYGDKKIWELYRRVHKGQLPKSRTRVSCIKQKVIATGSPCPVCRDEFLVLDYRNLDLLKMFISPNTGEVMQCN